MGKSYARRHCEKHNITYFTEIGCRECTDEKEADKQKYIGASGTC